MVGVSVQSATCSSKQTLIDIVLSNTSVCRIQPTLPPQPHLSHMDNTTYKGITFKFSVKFK